MIQLKMWKRSISVITALCMFGLWSANAVAAQNYENVEESYVKEAAGAYLHGTDYETLDGVSLSQAIDLYDLEDGTKYGSEYITFYGESIIGILYVSERNGKYYSSWREGTFEGLQKLIEAQDEFAIGFTEDNGVVAYSNSEAFDMCTGEIVCENVGVDSSVDLSRVYHQFESLDEYSRADTTKSDSPICGTDIAVQSANSDVPDEILAVTPVANETYRNSGLCWAAAIAAKYNYTMDLKVGKKNAKHITASQARLGAAEETGNDYTAGTPRYITAGLKHYGLLHSYMYNTMNATEIYAEMYWKNPILIDLFTPTGTGHTVLICGIKIIGTNEAKYYIADSDYYKNGLIEVYVDSDAFSDGSEFVYTSDAFASDYAMNSSKWAGTYSYKFES